MRLGVDLEDDSFSSHVLRGTRDLGCSRAARPTPFCPEIHQHGNLSVVEDFVEESRIRCQWFCDGRERGFAGAAPASAGEMPGGNTILLVALSTGSNDWHDGPPVG